MLVQQDIGKVRPNKQGVKRDPLSYTKLVFGGRGFPV
jgi:hypothetical protein